VDSKVDSGVCICLVLKPFEGLRHFRNWTTVSLVKPGLPSAHPGRQGWGGSISSLFLLRSEAGVCVRMCMHALSAPQRSTPQPLGLGPHPPTATTTTSVRTRRLKNCERVVGGEWTRRRLITLVIRELYDHEEERQCVFIFHPQSKGAGRRTGRTRPLTLPSCSA